MTQQEAIRTINIELDRIEKERDALQADQASWKRTAIDRAYQRDDFERERNEARAERDQLQRLFKDIANSTVAQLADGNTKLKALVVQLAARGAAMSANLTDETRHAWDEALLEARELL